MGYSTLLLSYVFERLALLLSCVSGQKKNTFSFMTSSFLLVFAMSPLFNMSSIYTFLLYENNFLRKIFFCFVLFIYSFFVLKIHCIHLHIYHSNKLLSFLCLQISCNVRYKLQKKFFLTKCYAFTGIYNHDVVTMKILSHGYANFKY